MNLVRVTPLTRVWEKTVEAWSKSSGGKRERARLATLRGWTIFTGPIGCVFRVPASAKSCSEFDGAMRTASISLKWGPWNRSSSAMDWRRQKTGFPIRCDGIISTRLAARVRVAATSGVVGGGRSWEPDSEQWTVSSEQLAAARAGWLPSCDLRTVTIN